MTDQPQPGSYPPPPQGGYPQGGYPPPPQGGYPPPPQQGGYPPPPQQGAYQQPQQPYAGGDFPGAAPQPVGYGGYGTPPQALPKDSYASWGKRVLAYLIDAVPPLILVGIGYGVAIGTGDSVCIDSETGFGGSCESSFSGLGILVVGITWLVSLAYWVWNLGYRQGTTGSSIGKSVAKVKIVGEATGQPVGFGMSIVRELIYWAGAGVCAGILWLVAVLFPLWDDKRQTLVDKILKHVALPTT